MHYAAFELNKIEKSLLDTEHEGKKEINTRIGR